MARKFAGDELKWESEKVWPPATLVKNKNAGSITLTGTIQRSYALRVRRGRQAKAFLSDKTDASLFVPFRVVILTNCKASKGSLDTYKNAISTGFAHEALDGGGRTCGQCDARADNSAQKFCAKCGTAFVGIKANHDELKSSDARHIIGSTPDTVMIWGDDELEAKLRAVKGAPTHTLAKGAILKVTTLGATPLAQQVVLEKPGAQKQELDYFDKDARTGASQIANSHFSQFKNMSLTKTDHADRDDPDYDSDLDD